MAKSSAVWGIDVGQCALKALRCRPHEKDDNRIVVEAFDYIEYPKILTQPEANREELVREALEQFVSRNTLLGDRVAISVPGQSGLARFIKLPPVEAKKIPDIVKYEARQQIPFALEDVVWDYQALAGGSVDEGYALETEVGLFAMKRDQVARALKPLEDVGVEIDIIQLAPLAIYNFVCFDQLGNMENYQRDNPPPSKVVLSLGTDTTDLVITDGFRVWQRSIPIGGNHFTKALTKELKLTFAKAEHLKRNAMKAENPKAVFQAMRPVFSDLVAEIQRSIGFFTSNNRNAKLGSVIALGNPMKLPGLQRFLAQNLDQDVAQIDDFKALVGGSVTAVPNFKENVLTFGVAYGLCVQALDKAQIHTNLLPGEIITKRLVKAKKPWAVAAAALLLTGMAVDYASHYSAWRSAAVLPEYNQEMARALQASSTLTSESGTMESTQTELTTKFDGIVTTAQNLVSNVEGRLLWLEVLKALDSALPKDLRPAEERKETAEDVTSRIELHIESMDCEYMDATATEAWYTGVAPMIADARAATFRQKKAEAAPATEAAAAGAAEDEVPAEAGTEGAAEGAEAVAEVPAEVPADAGVEGQAVDDGSDVPVEGAEAAGGPTGPGWVIQLKGYHFHNSYRGVRFVNNEGKEFVENTFFKALEEGTIQLPDGPNGALVDVPITKLGIQCPVVTTENPIINVTYFPEAVGGEIGSQAMNRMPEAGLGAAGDAIPAGPKIWKLRRYDFTIQMYWKPTPGTARQEKPAAAEGGESVDTVSVGDAAGPTG
ncbi:MAG: pilus assembly protein PilM [Pirellulales bacterium]